MDQLQKIKHVNDFANFQPFQSLTFYFIDFDHFINVFFEIFSMVSILFMFFNGYISPRRYYLSPST